MSKEDLVGAISVSRLDRTPSRNKTIKRPRDNEDNNEPHEET